jgi:hypothetical protein
LHTLPSSARDVCPQEVQPESQRKSRDHHLRALQVEERDEQQDDSGGEQDPQGTEERPPRPGRPREAGRLLRVVIARSAGRLGRVAENVLQGLEEGLDVPTLDGEGRVNPEDVQPRALGHDEAALQQLAMRPGREGTIGIVR